MDVEEVDRLCSTILLDTQVLTHSKRLPRSEWTSQSWEIQHLDGLAPDDACVMALMRHEKAGADDVDHQFQPVWSKAYAGLAALGQQHDVSALDFQCLVQVCGQRRLVLSNSIEAAEMPAYVVVREDGHHCCLALWPGQAL